jgi:hypothetical protein
LAGEFLDRDQISGGDLILFATGFDDCVHNLNPIAQRGRTAAAKALR